MPPSRAIILALTLLLFSFSLYSCATTTRSHTLAKKIKKPSQDAKEFLVWSWHEGNDGHGVFETRWVRADQHGMEVLAKKNNAISITHDKKLYVIVPSWRHERIVTACSNASSRTKPVQSPILLMYPWDQEWGNSEFVFDLSPGMHHTKTPKSYEARLTLHSSVGPYIVAKEELHAEMCNTTQATTTHTYTHTNTNTLDVRANNAMSILSVKERQHLEQQLHAKTLKKLSTKHTSWSTPKTPYISHFSLHYDTHGILHTFYQFTADTCLWCGDGVFSKHTLSTSIEGPTPAAFADYAKIPKGLVHALHEKNPRASGWSRVDLKGQARDMLFATFQEDPTEGH